MAKWSEIWSNKPITAWEFAALHEMYRFTPPSVKPRTKKGQYPHLQPFNDNLRPANRRKFIPIPMAA